MPTEEKHEIKMMYAVYADGRKEPIVIDAIQDLSLEEAEPILEEYNFVKVTMCKDCMHTEIDKYAPAECQNRCKLSQQYHDPTFFCKCGEPRTDLLKWIHRGDDDEQGV